MKKRIIITSISLFIFILIYMMSVNKISINSRIVILDKNNNEIVYLNNYNKTNTENINNLNNQYISYILCIEDKDFYSHNGFSIKRIIKSFFNNITSNSTEGASTITQQYIKNTYLSGDKKISRKIKEIILSIKLENLLSKDEILEEYLSALYFGNSIYGLTNAAKYYYNKDVNNLNINEMVSLIALWNAPAIYSNNIEKWNNKKNNIATILYNNKLLTPDEYKIATEKISLDLNKEYINSNRQYYIDQVINEFTKENINAEFNELITIHTQYNNETEKISSELDTNYSMISINKNGYITSCIGDNNYYKSKFNIAMNAKRDIGSTIKPLLYYEAIKCGFKNKTYKSQPYAFKYRDEIINISNHSNYYYNNINMKTALAVSDNIYAIKTHLNLGMNTLVNHLKKYNISASPYPSLALGSIGMSLKQLCSIYYQFFNDGLYLSNPKCITSIKINNHTFKYSPHSYRLLNNTICSEVKDLLSAPFDKNIYHSTCSGITNLLNSKCYGKSGLTDYDSYMIGFNEENLVAVWTGSITNDRLNNSEYKKLPKEIFTKTINSF